MIEELEKSLMVCDEKVSIRLQASRNKSHTILKEAKASIDRNNEEERKSSLENSTPYGLSTGKSGSDAATGVSSAMIKLKTDLKISEEKNKKYQVDVSRLSEALEEAIAAFEPLERRREEGEAAIRSEYEEKISRLEAANPSSKERDGDGLTLAAAREELKSAVTENEHMMNENLLLERELKKIKSGKTPAGKPTGKSREEVEEVENDENDDTITVLALELR